MKTKSLLMLLAIALVAGTAQANLLLNPSFEDGNFSGNNYTPDSWTHLWTSYAAMHTWISSADEAHSGSKYMKMNMWSWSSTAWLMQTVNVTAGQEYAFSVWAKCPIESELSEAQGHYEYLGAVSGVVNKGWLPLNPDVGSNWTYAEFGAVTAPAGATRVVYSIVTDIKNSVMGIIYDDAYVGASLASLPSPPWESLVPVGDVDFRWTNLVRNDPNDPVYVDVLFGAEPNETDPDCDMIKVVDAGENANSVTVNANDLGTYYWRVNSYMHGDPNEVNYTDPDPNSSPLYPIIEGHVWSFDTVTDAPPSFVGAGVDMITWSGEPVDLDATVDDDGQSTLNRTWSSYNFPCADVSFSDPNIEDPTVEIILDNYSAAGIINPSFEDALVGWDTVAGPGSGTWRGIEGSTGEIMVVPTDGDWIAWLNGSRGSVGGTWLSQILTETLAAGTTYTLKADVVHDGYYHWDDVKYKVQLVAGEKVIAEDDDSWPLDIYGEWKTSVVSVTTGTTSADPNFACIGEPLEIRLVAKDTTGEMTFDNVHLTADPEFPAPDSSTVELTLRASDKTNPTYVLQDTMTIDVYSTPCGAAKAVKGYPTDIDGDCVIGLKDLYLMAEDWLDITELTAPKTKGQDAELGLEWIAIGNAGFEDPPLFAGEWHTTCFNPPYDYYWRLVTGVDDAGIWDPGYEGYDAESPEGENCAYLGTGAKITQILNDTLAAKANYTLSIQVGNHYYYTGGTYTVELLAGGETLVTHEEEVEDIESNAFELRTLTYEHEDNLDHADMVGEFLEVTLSIKDELYYVSVDFDDVKLDIEVTDENLPSVTAGIGWSTWSGQPVALNSAVINNDTQDPNRPLSYEWTAEPATGVVFSETDILAPTVTITKATDNPSIVTLKLSVTLSGVETIARDSVKIDVYDDACKALIGTGGAYDIGDFSGNCITALEDIAVLGETWLVDYDTLTGPVPKP